MPRGDATTHRRSGLDAGQAAARWAVNLRVGPFAYRQGFAPQRSAIGTRDDPISADNPAGPPLPTLAQTILVLSDLRPVGGISRPAGPRATHTTQSTALTVY